MPKPLQKSLQDYLSKIKRSSSNNQLSSSTNWILSGCKHTKTLSFSQNDDGYNNNNNNNDAATLADIDRFLYENFRSLYIQDDEDHKKKGKMQEEESHRDKSLNAILFESPRLMEPPSDLCASHRFFVTPGTSGSLIEEARNSLTISEAMGSTSTSTSSTNKTLNRDSSTVSNDSKDVTLPDDCIAILTATPNPYNDFRCSMQEMVEARLQHGKVDWDFMEELLFCYLNLNAKRSYKYILRAFVDLVILLRQNSNKTPARSRKFRITRERRRRVRHVT